MTVPAREAEVVVALWAAVEEAGPWEGISQLEEVQEGQTPVWPR